MCLGNLQISSTIAGLSTCETFFGLRTAVFVAWPANPPSRQILDPLAADDEG